MKKLLKPIDFVTYSSLFLSPLYFFLGDNPVDKKGKMSYAGYTAVMYIILTLRDWLFWTSYVLCNVVLMERVAMKYPKIEMNGFCSALYLFSFNFGDSIGLLIGNYFYDKFGYNILPNICAGVLMVGFLGVILIRYVKIR